MCVFVCPQYSDQVGVESCCCCCMSASYTGEKAHATFYISGLTTYHQNKKNNSCQL